MQRNWLGFFGPNLSALLPLFTFTKRGLKISNFVILFCSFFAKYELPNLQVDKVSELMIIVAHTRSIPTGCDTDSIGMLREDAKKSKIKKVTCYDDPKYVVSQLNINLQFSKLSSHQEPITRSKQLPCTCVKVFSLTGLFLERFWSELIRTSNPLYFKSHEPVSTKLDLLL